jgi:hypothetical protein
MLAFLVFRSHQPRRCRRLPSGSTFPALRGLPNPLFAALARTLQHVENPVTLSPAFATLTLFVAPKSFACHSYKKTRGWMSCAVASSRSLFLPAPGTMHDPLTTYLLCFDTVPNSFALYKNLCPVFSSKSELFRQNTRGGVPTRPGFACSAGHQPGIVC